MGRGTDDEAHRPTRPVLWGRGRGGDEERIGVVLDGGGGCQVPLPDPAEALESMLVKLCGEAGVGGNGEVVEDVADGAGVLRGGDGARGEGMGEGVLEGGVEVVEPGEVGRQRAWGPGRGGRGYVRDSESLWGGLVVRAGADALLHAEGGVERHCSPARRRVCDRDTHT